MQKSVKQRLMTMACMGEHSFSGARGSGRKCGMAESPAYREGEQKTGLDLSPQECSPLPLPLSVCVCV